jgi:hypothetical protein
MPDRRLGRRSVMLSVAYLAIAIIGIVTIPTPAPASPSAIAASREHTSRPSRRSQHVSAEDRIATRDYLEATYVLEQGLVGNTVAQRPAAQALAGRIGGECAGVLDGAPQPGSVGVANGSDSGPSRSTSPARKIAEQIREEEQSNDLAQELRYSFRVTFEDSDRPAIQAFIATVKPLHWSDEVVTQQLTRELGELDAALHATLPPVCEDMKAWVASRFRTLSAPTKALVREREAGGLAAEKSVSGGPLTSLLFRYENAEDKAISKKTNQLVTGSRQATLTLSLSLQGILERLANVLGMSHQLKRPGAETSSTVLARGRTAAGEEFVAKLERKKTHSAGSEEGCSLDLSIRVSDNSSSICVSRSAETQAPGPSVNCASGRLTVTENTPARVRSVRLLLSNGTQIASRVIFVSPKMGGPFGLYYQVVRGPSPIPVSLVELNERGRIVRSVSLPHIVECTKNPVKYFPDGVRTLVRTSVPAGPDFAIVGEHYRFLGHDYFQLSLQLEQPSPNGPGFLSYSPDPLRRRLPWNSETGCKPHPFLIIYSLLENPSDMVLVGSAGKLVPMQRVRIPASMRAGGVLVYIVAPALPSELVLRAPSGKTIATESLQALVTETRESCEGAEEGPSASAGP